MAFQFVVLAACLALASAGGPAAYNIASSSGDLSSIGFSQESTQKGYGGQNVISSYSKSDDSAHSFVRVSSQSISNDGYLNYAPIVKAGYAAQTYLAPTATPLIAKSYAAPYSYGSPLLAKSYALPYNAPLLAKSYAAPAPLIAKTAIAAPAPLIAKAAIAAPAQLYAKTYSAPLLQSAPAASFLHAAPAASLLTKSYEYAAHSPVYAKSALLAPSAYTASIAPAAYTASIAPAAYTASIAPAAYTTSIAQAPLLTKTYATAPSAALYSKAYSYEAAAPVVHTVFNGLGTSYAW